MKKVLITGIAGQDGSYLAEYLLSLGYEVHGLARWVSIETPESKLFRISHILDKIKMHYSSIENFSSIFQIINEVKPDECYHLAAQSYVSYSLEDESNTISSNIIGTQNLFSALRMLTPQCKLYFAASSEIFGRTEVSPQNEKTAISPRSLYGITKASGVFLSRNYREQYNMFIANGILFNHESIRRGTEFVTRKITSSAAKIKLGIIDRIELGSLESVRDWGHAKDYVRGMHLMLQYSTPEDFILATGHPRTVRELLEHSFNLVGLDPYQYLKINEALVRPPEKFPLVGNPEKANKLLNWKPQISFNEMIKEMVDHDLQFYSTQRGQV